ncbi:Transposon Tf2-12 polyprotein [Sesamum angolense]|uniref:Transposon Tf2-12 polyprotein n=1 Tax=Sesamum angolense TaxID=2727404 RepID=A0AAE2BTR4_9LAMI|nr:Transposon Tf2-12 polyprotein [Sesamum angolense]
MNSAAEQHKSIELIPGELERVTRIGPRLGENLETRMIKFLKKNADMFTWNPSNYKGINPEVIVHKLNIDPMARLVKQKKRSFELKEIESLRKSWCPGAQKADHLKNEYQWNRTRATSRATSIGGLIRSQHYYCQIKALTDSSLGGRPSSLRTPMEVYVDDMLVKSKTESDHLAHLEQAFKVMRAYGMKMNLAKCTFGVQRGRFLGYMVSERGIKSNLEKIEAIMQLKSPKTLKDVQKLTDKKFKWTEECEQALMGLKQYLTSPPLLTKLKSSEPLYWYLAVSEETMSSVLVREEGKTQSLVYYVSKVLQGVEKRYAQIEKLALALIVTARKLRSYFQSHKITVFTNHPLRHIIARPNASGRLIKWVVEIGEHDIEYQNRTTINAQILADFIAEFAYEQVLERQGSWLLHVDGSSNANNGGAGVLLQGPDGIELEVAARLSFATTNNKAEYEILVLGLEFAEQAGAKGLDVYIDSQLVAMQDEGSYETRE